MPEPSEAFNPKEYWEQRLKPFDLAAVGYRDFGEGFNRWVYRVRRHVFRSVISSLDSQWEGQGVLDIGSGTGVYVSEWLRAGASVTGSDLTDVSVSRLSSSFPTAAFRQWDVSEEPPFEPDSFEAISAFDVLFHIVDDSRYASALANVARLLRSGGYFLFSEMLLHGETVRVSHQASRPLKDVESLLEANGFELVARRPMLVAMNPPIDSSNAFLGGLWRVLDVVLTRMPASGRVIGPLLYPIEVVLVSSLNESPTTEVVVCRKRPV